MNGHVVDPEIIKEFIYLNASVLVKNNLMNAQLAETYNQYAKLCKVKPPFVKISNNEYKWNWDKERN